MLEVMVAVDERSGWYRSFVAQLIQPLLRRLPDAWLRVIV